MTKRSWVVIMQLTRKLHCSIYMYMHYAVAIMISCVILGVLNVIIMFSATCVSSYSNNAPTYLANASCMHVHIHVLYVGVACRRGMLMSDYCVCL